MPLVGIGHFPFLGSAGGGGDAIPIRDSNLSVVELNEIATSARDCWCVFILGQYLSQLLLIKLVIFAKSAFFKFIILLLKNN